MKTILTTVLLFSLSSCTLMRAPKTVRECYLILKEACCPGKDTLGYGVTVPGSTK